MFFLFTILVVVGYTLLYCLMDVSLMLLVLCCWCGWCCLYVALFCCLFVVIVGLITCLLALLVIVYCVAPVFNCLIWLFSFNLFCVVCCLRVLIRF